MAANRRAGARGESGPDTMTLLLGATAVAIGLKALLDSAALAVFALWVVAILGILAWRLEVGRRRRRAAALARRRAMAARRAQRIDRRVLRRVEAMRGSERPIGPASPLPRAWWQPVRLAGQAVADYRAGLTALPDGPVRERLAEGLAALQAGAAQLEGLARRGAELDRQLRRFQRVQRRGPLAAAAAEGDPRIARLKLAIAGARSSIAERLHALQCAALDVAEVGLAMSLARAERVVDGVEGSLTEAAGVAAALDELRTLEQR